MRRKWRQKAEGSRQSAESGKGGSKAEDATRTAANGGVVWGLAMPTRQDLDFFGGELR